jgi:hypothetical protein
MLHSTSVPGLVPRPWLYAFDRKNEHRKKKTRRDPQKERKRIELHKVWFFFPLFFSNLFLAATERRK